MRQDTPGDMRLAIGEAFAAHRAPKVVVLEDGDTRFSCPAPLLVSAEFGVLKLLLESGNGSGADGVDNVFGIKKLACSGAVEPPISAVPLDRPVILADAVDTWFNQFSNAIRPIPKRACDALDTAATNDPTASRWSLR